MKLITTLVLLTTTHLAMAKNLVIGVENTQYMPFFSSEKGEFKGYARELFDDFGKNYGYSIQYKALPVIRLNQYLLEERIDAKFPDNPKWNQAAKANHNVQYSEDANQFTDGVLTPASKKGQDINRVATIRGFIPWPLMDLVSAGKLQLKEDNSLEVILKRISMGRTSAAYLNVDVAKYYAQNSNIYNAETLVLDESKPYATGGYKLSSISRQDAITDFNDYLKNHANTVNALKAKYSIQ